MNVAVVLTGDESYEEADDKLIEAAADVVKRNGVLNNQLEVQYLPHSVHTVLVCYYTDSMAMSC